MIVSKQGKGLLFRFDDEEIKDLDIFLDCCYDLDSFYRIDVPLFPKTIMPLVRELLWFIIDNAEKEIE